MSNTIPRVKSVTAAKSPWTLNVEWNDGTKSRVDLTGLVHSSRHFSVFADDPVAFRAVQPDEFGSGIEWKNGLDYAAATLKMLAEEQKPVKGKHLRVFESRYKLNTKEVARLFDVTTKTISNYRELDELPKAFSIALKRFEHDPTAFAAHYRPVETKPRGRPKHTLRSK